MEISILILVIQKLWKNLPSFKMPFIKDFLKSIDLARINKVLKDEGLDLNVLNPKWDFVTSSISMPSFSRNPFADLISSSVQDFSVGGSSSSSWNPNFAEVNLKENFNFGGKFWREIV